MSLPQIPAATYSSDNYEQLEHVALQLLPNGLLSKPIAIKDVGITTAVNVQLATNDGTKIVVISSEDYGCYYRFKTAADTADVTSADGGNARGKVLPGTQRPEVPISGATYISLIGGSGTARVTIEQRA